MSHWMREELARGEGMRTCNHFATASKMSVVEFEGSVSEATTCKRTCVCLRYRLDAATGTVALGAHDLGVPLCHAKFFLAVST